MKKKKLRKKAYMKEMKKTGRRGKIFGHRDQQTLCRQQMYFNDVFAEHD